MSAAATAARFQVTRTTVPLHVTNSLSRSSFQRTTSRTPLFGSGITRRDAFLLRRFRNQRRGQKTCREDHQKKKTWSSRTRQHTRQHTRPHLHGGSKRRTRQKMEQRASWSSEHHGRKKRTRQHTRPHRHGGSRTGRQPTRRRHRRSRRWCGLISS